MEYATGFLVGFGVFSGAVAVLFVLFQRGARAAFGPRRRLEEDLGVDVLRHRLARGEITRRDFEDAKRTLGR